jgi:hypothetical protein
VSKGTPYWRAFLTHPYNRALALGIVAVSLGLSLPWGADGLGLGMLVLAAVQMIGLAVVPGLPNFQAFVNRRDRLQEREARRASLLQEIRAHGDSAHLRSYEQMCVRVASLYKTAGDRSTALTEREVEQLDDLTVDYLRMCLSDAVMRGSKAVALTPAITYKLRDVQSKIDEGGLGPDDEQQLRQAKAEEAIAHQMRMAARRSALDATLVSMPVRLEEVFQMVMASPRAGNLRQLLEESVSKLRLAEEAALDVEHALGPARIEPASVNTDGNGAAQDKRRAIGQRG